MPMPSFTSPYAAVGGLFLGLALAGVLFFGWGELRLAFLLIVYCVLIIGFRLDEIARRLDTIDRRLAVHLGDPAAGQQAPPGGDRPSSPPGDLP